MSVAPSPQAPGAELTRLEQVRIAYSELNREIALWRERPTAAREARITRLRTRLELLWWD